MYPQCANAGRQKTPPAAGLLLQPCPAAHTPEALLCPPLLHYPHLHLQRKRVAKVGDHCVTASSIIVISGRRHRQHVRSAAAAMSSSACARNPNLATSAVPFAFAAAPLSYPLACKGHPGCLPQAASSAVQGLCLQQQPCPVVCTPEALLWSSLLCYPSCTS